MRNRLTYYEFFAGGGMARAGLGPDWYCLFANDFDPKKALSYQANWGGKTFHFGDIHDISAKELPGHADLAWASFPCQDLSLAGNGAGLAGGRSGAFWGVWNILNQMPSQRRPKLLVFENVTGTLTSNQGADFEALCRALTTLGYVIGGLTIDASHFLPQSRPRLFIICVSKMLPYCADLERMEPTPQWHSPALIKAAARLPELLRQDWRWWHLPEVLRRNNQLADLVDDDTVEGGFHNDAETAYLISLMAPPHIEKLNAAKAEARATCRRVVGTIYRRTRLDESGEKVQRAEIRFDGLAGCLRTPGGGSSRQLIAIIDKGRVQTRLLSCREAARLMGLPDDYVLPQRYNDAYHLLGDGLAVPVVRFLRLQLLERLLDGVSLSQVAAE